MGGGLRCSTPLCWIRDPEGRRTPLDRSYNSNSVSSENKLPFPIDLCNDGSMFKTELPHRVRVGISLTFEGIQMQKPWTRQIPPQSLRLLRLAEQNCSGKQAPINSHNVRLLHLPRPLFHPAVDRPCALREQEWTLNKAMTV